MAKAVNSATAGINANGALDPRVVAIFANVAKGDLSAQRCVRQAWMDTLQEKPRQPKPAGPSTRAG